MERQTIAIDGMSCGHCVAAVRKALEAVDGVEVEDVSIGSATVAYDPEAVSLEQITDSVRDAGYDAVGAGR
jgi:copper chaperone